MANSSPSFAVLDPDTYKQNLITYLKSQTIFKDYDFTGSTMNVLLDILAQNTYQNAFYMNMMFSESFLDTAQLKNSVISRVKEMQYLPRSMKSSEAILNLQIQTSNTNSLELPAGLRFSGLNSNSSYQFMTNENSIYFSSNGYFNIPSLTVYDGFYTTETFVVDYTNENQSFDLSNPNIDTDSLTVYLTENGNTYTLSLQSDLFGIDSNSYIYFIQASTDDKYTIVFGDGVTGHRPLNNSVIQATYRMCAGPDADGVTTFTLSDNLGAINNTTINSLTINVVSPSSGGGASEDINSIKFNAINSSKAQNRAVVASDYKQLIKENFQNVSDVNVYGGTATSTSVDYGRVFISVINTAGEPISLSQKADVVNFISQRNTVGISPVMVDPSDMLLDVSTLLHVDISNTSLTIPEYQSIVSNGIINFNTTNLNKFDTTLRFSKLTDMIDSLDQYILSNETTVTMKIQIEATLNTPYSCTMNFYNAITSGSVFTPNFLSSGISYYITDTVSGVATDGTLYLVNYTSPSIYSKIGNVNYDTGVVSTSAITVNDYLNSPGVVFYATSKSKDIYGQNNTILQIDPTTISVQVVNL